MLFFLYFVSEKNYLVNLVNLLKIVFEPSSIKVFSRDKAKFLGIMNQISRACAGVRKGSKLYRVFSLPETLSLQYNLLLLLLTNVVP